MTKLFIATPQYGGMCSGFYQQSVLGLQAVLGQMQIECMIAVMFNESLIPRARNALAQQFLASDATHLFFIDADIKFNPGDIPLMVQSDKDVICGIYPKKEINWFTVADAVKRGVPVEELKYHTGAWVINLFGHKDTVTVRADQPLEVYNGGTGFMLIKREVLEKMKPTTPIYRNDVGDLSGQLKAGDEIYQFFDTYIEHDTEKDTVRLLSEDYEFCRRWRALGGKVWAAPWVQLGHFGSYLFEGRLLATQAPCTQEAAQ
jgi:hypothetical protein